MAPPSLELLWKNLPLLLDGLRATLWVAALSVVFGIALGCLVGQWHLSRRFALRLSAQIYLQAFRIIPVIVWLFVVFFALPTATDLSISGDAAAILVFSLWGGAEMSDLVRGALSSIPRAQYEAGRALGLSEHQVFLHVVAPQAVRRLLPGTVNLVTRMIKTSSLVILVGVVDVVKRTQQVIERTQQPLTFYLFLFILFFALCYPLSLIARHLEKRWPA